MSNSCYYFLDLHCTFVRCLVSQFNWLEVFQDVISPSEICDIFINLFLGGKCGGFHLPSSSIWMVCASACDSKFQLCLLAELSIYFGENSDPWIALTTLLYTILYPKGGAVVSFPIPSWDHEAISHTLHYFRGCTVIFFFTIRKE